MSEYMLKDELLKQLDELDEEISLSLKKSGRMYMVIVGGAALILQDFNERSTLDIDVIEVSKGLESRLPDYSINSGCALTAATFTRVTWSG